MQVCVCVCVDEMQRHKYNSYHSIVWCSIWCGYISILL